MNIPDNLRYTKDHEWVRVEGTEAVIGVTDFAQNELGDIVFVDLPAPGKAVNQGESFCVVESTKAASDVYAPIGGTVKAVNAELGKHSELVNSSPYDQGWLVRLENVNKADLEKLLSPADYRKLIEQK